MLAPHLNEVSDSGLIQRHRGGLVFSQDPWPLPVPLFWEEARVTQATRISAQSTHCCLGGKSHQPRSRRTFLVTGKASLACRKSCLYVWLCVGAAARVGSGGRDAGKRAVRPCENRRSICSRGSLHAARAPGPSSSPTKTRQRERVGVELPVEGTRSGM